MLRQRATTDIATKGGQFDIITIGSYEAPIWGKQKWLVPLDDLGADYDYADIIPSVKSGLSYDGNLYAVPFYAESSFTFYRKDLFEKAGIKMPDKPTYDQIAEYAAKLTDKSKEQYGFCQRGKPGWGENMAFVGPMVNAFGGRWFDEKWEPQLTSEPWKAAVSLLRQEHERLRPPRRHGERAQREPGAVRDRPLRHVGRCHLGRRLHLQPEGKPGRRQDRLHGGADPGDGNGSGWFWAWSLGIPASSKKVDAAKSFVKWATSKDYIAMVGERGRLGLRASRHAQVDLRQSRIPEGGAVREGGLRVDRRTPTSPSRPRIRCPMSASSTSRSPNSRASARWSASRSPRRSPGRSTVDQALETAQRSTERTMKQAGYPK